MVSNNSITNLRNNAKYTFSEILQFEFTKMELILLKTSFYILVIFGYILNFTVLYLYCKDKRIRESTVIFVPIIAVNDVCLDIWETLQNVLSEFLTVDNLLTPLCILTYSVGVSFSVQSQYFLFMTFVYRYVKINNPFDYDKYLANKRLIIIVFGIFLFGTCVSLSPVLISAINYTGKGSCNGYYHYKSEYLPLVILLMLPVLIGALIYHIKTLKIAKKHTNLMGNQTKKLKNISKSSKASFLQLLLTILIWILFMTVILKFVFDKNHIQVKKFMFGITHVIIFQTSLNPIFSIYGNVSIKIAFLQIIRYKGQSISPR